MKKLRLNADALRVESFPMDAVANETGTVHGHAPTLQVGSCPALICRTYDDTLCGLTQAC
ncbi:MAG TPA: hypothetical protein VK358_01335 [Longimicrobium sp.]|nr:hypothetical protein [Longimicrobium sp.]